MTTVLLIHLVGVVGGFLRASIMGVVGERVVARVRNQLYGSILRQEIAFFDAHKSGELVSRLGSDTTLLQQGTSNALPEVAIGVTKTIVCVALMFWLSPKLAALSFGAVFIILICSIFFGGWIAKLSRAYQDVLGKAQTYSTEALGAMRTVQSFAAEEREKQRYQAERMILRYVFQICFRSTVLCKNKLFRPRVGSAPELAHMSHKGNKCVQ